MANAKNIVLVGMPFDRNLGDQAIYEVTRHSVRQFFARRGIPVRIRTVDIGSSKNGRIYTDPRLYKYYKKLRKKIFQIRYGTPYSLSVRVEADCMRTIGPSTDAVIVVGGAMLKFRQAPFYHEALGIVLRHADLHRVPVMLSGIGVEGYDESFPVCLSLKRSISRPCVKAISTRDDLDTLKTCYLENHDRIRAVKVSDAACSLPLLYPAAKRTPGVIGLGVARDRLFPDYGNSVSWQTLLELYAGIYRNLTEKGCCVKIFSNGALDDQKAADRLREYLHLNRKDKEHVCPRPENVGSLAAVISSCQAVVVTRLHSSIIAYAYGVPFVGLVWNQKQRFFGESIGCPDRFLSIPEFDAERIAEKLLRAMESGYPDTKTQAYKESNARELEKFLSQYV